MDVSKKRATELKALYESIATELGFKFDSVYDNRRERWEVATQTIVGLVPATGEMVDGFLYIDIVHEDNWVSFGRQFTSPSGMKHTETLLSCNMINIREGLELARELLAIKDRAFELKIRSIVENNASMENENA